MIKLQQGGQTGGGGEHAALVGGVGRAAHQLQFMLRQGAYPARRQVHTRAHCHLRLGGVNGAGDRLTATKAIQENLQFFTGRAGAISVVDDAILRMHDQAGVLAPVAFGIAVLPHIAIAVRIPAGPVVGGGHQYGRALRSAYTDNSRVIGLNGMGAAPLATDGFHIGGAIQSIVTQQIQQGLEGVAGLVMEHAIHNAAAFLVIKAASPTVALVVQVAAPREGQRAHGDGLAIASLQYILL